MSISVVKGKCVFPSVEKDKDKRITVTKQDIKEMKKLRKTGMSYDNIGIEMNRPKNVVKAYLIKNFSKKYTVYTSRCNTKRYKNDERFRTLLKQSVKENQRLRYKNDIEYRIYNACKEMGCSFLKKRYGSLEKYREYRLKCFQYEINPSISDSQYKELRRNLRRKYLVRKNGR